MWIMMWLSKNAKNAEIKDQSKTKKNQISIEDSAFVNIIFIKFAVIVIRTVF